MLAGVVCIAMYVLLHFINIETYVLDQTDEHDFWIEICRLGQNMSVELFKPHMFLH